MKHNPPKYCISPERLSQDQIKQFQESGYPAFSGVLSAEETEASREALRRLIDKEAYDLLFVDRRGTPASCRAASRLGF